MSLVCCTIGCTCYSSHLFKLIVEKELREIIGSRKFAVTFGVCSILILLSFLSGARAYRVSTERYEAAVSQNLRQMEELTDWEQVDNHRIFLPPQPLEALVSGVSNDVGRTIEIEGRGELVPVDSRYSEDPIFAVFRFLDLEFIFTAILSLFAILFAYGTVSGEKESGTLRLIMSNQIPRDKLILGKLVGSLLGLGVPLLIPLLLGCLLLPILGVPMSGEDWTRLGLIILLGMGCFSVFVTLGVMVSVMTRRSSISFLLLLASWILLVLIIPRTAVLTGGRAVDVPNLDQINTEKNVYRLQLWSDDREKMSSFQPEAQGDMQAMIGEFQAFMETLSEERDQKMREFAQELDQEKQNGERLQQRIAFALARISPAAVFGLAASQLANTAVALKSDFVASARDYQVAYAGFMKEKTGRAGGGGFRMLISDGDEEEEPERIDLTELPAFEYAPPALSDRLRPVIVNGGLLFLFNLVFFAVATVGFLRYDPR